MHLSILACADLEVLVFFFGDHRNLSVALISKKEVILSSDDVELFGIVIAVTKYLKSTRENQRKNVVIFSDSATAISKMAELETRPSHATVFDPKNWDQELQLKLFLLRKHIDFTVVKVGGHKNVHGNEMADSLAKSGTKLAFSNVNCPSADFTWSKYGIGIPSPIEKDLRLL